MLRNHKSWFSGDQCLSSTFSDGLGDADFESTSLFLFLFVPDESEVSTLDVSESAGEWDTIEHSGVAWHLEALRSVDEHSIGKLRTSEKT
jgi:hypothetical protein